MVWTKAEEAPAQRARASALRRQQAQAYDANLKMVLNGSGRFLLPSIFARKKGCCGHKRVNMPWQSSQSVQDTFVWRIWSRLYIGLYTLYFAKTCRPRDTQGPSFYSRGSESIIRQRALSYLGLTAHNLDLPPLRISLRGMSFSSTIP